MKKLFVKNRRKTLVKTTMLYSKKVASIFIIVLGLLFGTLLFNTEVQAIVGKVLIEWYAKFTSFAFRDDQVIDEMKDWVLNYLPRGYIEKNYEVLGNITNISVDNENREIDSCIILGNEAFSISPVNDKFDNGVIWNMDGHTFDLWGKIPMDELKKMAESISEK